MTMALDPKGFALVREGTGFNPLPKGERGHSSDNTCACPWCTDDRKTPGHNPDGVWDTLATNLDTGETWNVHMPELHGRKQLRSFP